MGFMAEKKYTGKEETITINADTPVTTFSMGNGKPEQKTICASDIKAGQILQVWYNRKQ